MKYKLMADVDTSRKGSKHENVWSGRNKFSGKALKISK